MTLGPFPSLPQTNLSDRRRQQQQQQQQPEGMDIPLSLSFLLPY